jgi:predicted aldo/keto reductase-like oxidoreductase
METDMERRDFLKTALAASLPVAAGGILESFGAAVRADEPQSGGSPRSDETLKGEMIYRQLGKTGERVSVIGLGGFHIGMQGDQQESIRIIREAVDHGINFMDNSWDYNGGESEIRMGKALEDGYRDKVFLMTKIDGRTKRAAAEQIDESLKRLKTDRIDLMQHHEVIRLEDPDRIFAPGGAQEAMFDARKAGKIRFIGFTGHKDPMVHLRMLDMADKHDFRFDAVQMPLNVMDAHFRSFEKKVLPILVKKEIGVLGMKSMGFGVILRSNLVKPVECLHYAMSLPTSTVITGIDSLDILRQDIDAVRDFKPLTSQQIASLLERTAPAAAEGRFEPFKTGNMFDSTAHNPRWLG